MLPVVAVFNTSPDTVDMLRMALEQAGFVVISAMTFDIRDGRTNIEAFLEQHQPDVIVYDIALPYEANWRLFCHIRTLPAVRRRPVIVTTTNARHVRPLADTEPVHEVVGKPYDLDALIETVRTAAASVTGSADVANR
jgi:CheY-like chemotaxis protein